MTSSLRLMTNLGFASLLAIELILLANHVSWVFASDIWFLLFPAGLMILLGRLVDHGGRHVQFKHAILTVSALSLLLFFWFGARTFLAISLLLCFWGGHLLNHPTDEEHQNTRWSFGMGALVAALAVWISYAWAEVFDIFLVLALLLLTLLFIGLAMFQKGWSQIAPPESVPQSGAFRDLKILILQHGFSFTLAGVFLGIQTGWPLPAWPVLAGWCAMGILLSRWNIPLLGHKRTLALIYLIMMGLFLYNPSDLQLLERRFFLSFYLALFCAERWTTTSLFKRSLPTHFSGFFSGLLVFSSIAGMVVGYWIQTTWSLSWIPIILLLVVMVLNQTIYPERASGEANNQPLKETPWGNAWLHSSQDASLWKLKTWSTYLQRTFCELFFGKIRVRGLENLKDIRGALFVANHPNTFFDPLLISSTLPFSLKFLAKSTLWHIPVIGGFLDYLGLIPVYRACDMPLAERQKNKKSLGHAAEHIQKGGYILIFPEGVSQSGLTLKPVKTGAARIAFQAHELSDWTRELPIIPIGIDYEKPSVFRSSVTIRIGEPLSLLDRKTSYTSEPRMEIKAATKRLEEELCRLIPHLDSEQKEALTHQITDLYGQQLSQIMQTEDPNEARLAIANAVNHYTNTDPSSVIQFQDRLQTYLKTRQHLEIDATAPPLSLGTLISYAKAVFSPHMLGLVLHWLPYTVTRKIVAAMPLDFVWQATAKLVTGLVIYPLYYAALHLVFVSLFGPLSAYILIACTLLSGILALGHFNRYDFLFQPLETLWNAFWKRDTHKDLAFMRTQLLQDLERFREAYAFHIEELEKPPW